ncbi:MAG: glycosyltransferase [Rhizobiales bacterium]|nr:glycosyltransferase [Hyphomicrobiales bacterium]
MDQPLVSTITPCFRMKRYLKKFLEWLPEQDIFEKLEIVLDHNEPDEEEIKWVQDFQEKYPNRIKHIIVEKVDPIGVSMNRCIKEASGEFVTIWNVDDLRTSASISQQVDALQKTPGAEIAFGDYKIVTSFGLTEGEIVEHDQFPETEFTRGMIFGPFIMFRKSLCEKAGYFDEALKSGADFDLSVRLALHGKAVKTKGLLGYYLNEGLGASTRPNSLQPIERTVIELRYGIYDKIEYQYLPKALNYDIRHIELDGQKLNVSDFVPDYENWIQKRETDWFDKGLQRSARQTSLQNSGAYQGLRTVKSYLRRLKEKTSQ